MLARFPGKAVKKGFFFSPPLVGEKLWDQEKLANKTGSFPQEKKRVSKKCSISKKLCEISFSKHIQNFWKDALQKSSNEFINERIKEWIWVNEWIGKLMNICMNEAMKGLFNE